MEEPVQLCSRCANIDIDQLWASTGTKVALGAIAHWNFDSCAFCKFLGELLSPIPGISHRNQLGQTPEREGESESRSSRSYYLYSRKSRESSWRLLQELEPRLIVLSSSEHGFPPKGVPYIAVHPTKPPFWLRQLQPLVGFDQLKEWLDLCFQLHAGGCGDGRDNLISDLRLIDCTTGEVTKAKANEPYVALSYVWGHDNPLIQNPTQYPQTIQDAITATRKLGYNWLWVDKYCVDQLDIQKQLQQMDAIYRQAVVTIIAAAGTHADYGLLGVSRRRCKPTSSVTVGQRTLSAIRDIPDLSSDNCKWGSRAWV